MSKALDSFVHLHVHSEYSILDSVITLDKLFNACQQHGMTSVAVTDLCNIFGAVKFYKKAKSYGIKPIFGSELWLEHEGMIIKGVVLCQNDQGFASLREILTQAYLKAPRDKLPRIPLNWLFEKQAGLIFILLEDETLTQCMHSQKTDAALSHLKSYEKIFSDRFYLGLTKTTEPHDPLWRIQIKLAQKGAYPVVAMQRVCFIQAQDFGAHEARVCIQEGTTLNQPRAKNHHETFYFQSPEEMAKSFQQVPSALLNAQEIAKRCNVHLSVGEVCLPNFPIPEGDTPEAYLCAQAQKGLEKRLNRYVLPELEATEKDKTIQEYQARLARELDVINSMGFASYFLIVADFIQWAIDQDIPVGPGRGSGAGSLVAYALNITNLDPMTYELLFERFLNPERVSMPDFDIDFCMERRDEVIEYVAQRYGRESVAQIATFGTMAAKAVVRDVGRVLGHPYGFVDKIAKLIPFELGMTLDKALKEDGLKSVYKSDEEVKTLIDLAKKLEGLTRNVGKHAGGVVIAPKDITAFSPLYCEQGSEQAVTQFDKDDVEAIGLVKFDFLGLRTLTIIQWAVEFANDLRKKQNEAALNISDIPLDDPKTYDELKACHTTAVFQLESRGMKELIHRLQPDHFEEIIALVALFRPGPLQSGMVDDFIDRKHGRAKVEYPHPDIAPILKPTYGVILYQEQVMQIAQVLAGYTLGGADLLRRAMGKKKVEEMAKQREIFVEGATARGVDKEVATGIFDLMEKFAGYGFNKSHSAAYALVSYQTAWLKTHYPNAFMAAVLSSDMAHTDKVVTFIEEVKKMKLDYVRPNINESHYRFTLNESGAIVYGLGAIKGVGEGAIESIIEGRSTGPYVDLLDFCKRVDTRKVNRRVMEALIKSGSMDVLEQERAVLMASLDSALMQAEQAQRDQASGQVDMFAAVQAQAFKWTSADPFPEDVRLKGEKDTLGFYLSGHPLNALKNEMQHFVTHPLGALPEREAKVVVAGIVNQMRTLQTKKGDRMAFISLDDGTGRFEVAIFADLFKKRRELITKDNILVVSGTLSIDRENQQIRLRAEEALDLAHARARYAQRLRLTLKQEAFTEFENLTEGLKSMLLEAKGDCPVVVDYQPGAWQAKMHLGHHWKVLPTEDFIAKIKESLGEEALVLEYQ